MDLESLEDFFIYLKEGKFTQLNKVQRIFLQEKFNAYIYFEYGEYDNYIIKMYKRDFESFEEHLGMKYERWAIISYLENNDIVLIEYAHNDRLNDIIDLLESIK